MYRSEDTAAASRGTEVYFLLIFQPHLSMDCEFLTNGMSFSRDFLHVYTFDYGLSSRAIERASSSVLFCFTPSTSHGIEYCVGTIFGNLTLPTKIQTRPARPANLNTYPNPTRLPAESIMQIILVLTAYDSISGPYYPRSVFNYFSRMSSSN